MSNLSLELKAYFEILRIAEEDLQTYLTMDHPPPDYLQKIYNERILISDLMYIIRDLKVQIAANEFSKFGF